MKFIIPNLIQSGEISHSNFKENDLHLVLLNIYWKISVKLDKNLELWDFFW